MNNVKYLFFAFFVFPVLVDKEHQRYQNISKPLIKCFA